MYIVMYTYEVLRTYSIAVARSRLAAIVDEAEAGGEVELTRRGQPVAVVVSRRELDRLRGRGRDFREAYQAFRGRCSPADFGPGREIAGPRDRSPGRNVSL